MDMPVITCLNDGVFLLEREYVADAAVSIIYVIIGIIIAVVVLAILTTAFCIFTFCRRQRQMHAGSVYRTTEPAVAMTTASGDNIK